MRNNLLMKFTLEERQAVTVRHVERGLLKIGTESVTENVVLFRNRIRPGWDAATVEALTEADFADLMAERPEIVILGTGWQPALPPRELVFAMARRGIGFETMDTPAACRTFNILLSEDRDAAAILLLR